MYINNNVIRSLQANLTHLPRSEYVPGIGLGIAKCPYDPQDNSTAIYVESGNPGGLPALVSIFSSLFLSCVCIGLFIFYFFLKIFTFLRFFYRYIFCCLVNEPINIKHFSVYFLYTWFFFSTSLVLWNKCWIYKSWYSHISNRFI